MRAPQYGSRKGNRRKGTNAAHAALPRPMKPAGGFTRYRDGTLAAVHEPVKRIRYFAQKDVKVTLRLWHKSAMKDGELVAKLQGNIVTKAARGSKDQAQG